MIAIINTYNRTDKFKLELHIYPKESNQNIIIKQLDGILKLNEIDKFMSDLFRELIDTNNKWKDATEFIKSKIIKVERTHSTVLIKLIRVYRDSNN